MQHTVAIHWGCPAHALCHWDFPAADSGLCPYYCMHACGPSRKTPTRIPWWSGESASSTTSAAQGGSSISGQTRMACECIHGPPRGHGAPPESPTAYGVADGRRVGRARQKRTLVAHGRHRVPQHCVTLCFSASGLCLGRQLRCNHSVRPVNAQQKKPVKGVRDSALRRAAEKATHAYVNTCVMMVLHGM